MRRQLVVLYIALATSGCSSDKTAETSCDLPSVTAPNCETVHAMRLPTAPAPARGNKYADDESAAYLGFKLFFSTELGSGVGCPTCHLPELAFTDRKSISTGKEPGSRNAPT